MRTLPFDNFRCVPDKPDQFCNNCLRLATAPWQTAGERTLYCTIESSASEMCRYIPIEKDLAQPTLG